MDQPRRIATDSSTRRIVAVSAAAVLAITGGALGGYVTGVLAQPAQEVAGTETAGARDELRQERERSQRLEGQLAGALKHIATQSALLADAAVQNQTLIDIRQELQAEKEHAASLSAAGGEQASALRQAAEREATALRGQITTERDKVDGLTRDLAAAQRENEELRRTLKAAALTSRLEDLQQALRQSEAQRESLAEELRAQTAAAAPKPKFVSAEAGIDRQTPSVAPPGLSDPETRRLMMRARQLIEERNISAARQILERATDVNHAPALFALAETYDPNILAAWGTVGTQGDVGRARMLYRKALAGGVAESDARLKALP